MIADDALRQTDKVIAKQLKLEGGASSVGVDAGGPDHPVKFSTIFQHENSVVANVEAGPRPNKKRKTNSIV